MDAPVPPLMAGLPRVLLEVGPLDAGAGPSGSSSQPSTFSGSSYWEIW